jgi:hypothetical protein
MDSDNASKEAFQNQDQWIRQQSQLTLLADPPLRSAVSDQARHRPRRLLRYRPSEHMLLSTHGLEEWSTKRRTSLTLRSGIVFESFGVLFHGIQQSMV